jgi:uncharacterized protein (UPF0128 family)
MIVAPEVVAPAVAAVNNVGICHGARMTTDLASSVESPCRNVVQKIWRTLRQAAWLERLLIGFGKFSFQRKSATADVARW